MVDGVVDVVVEADVVRVVTVVLVVGVAVVVVVTTLVDVVGVVVVCLVVVDGVEREITTVTALVVISTVN